MPFNLFDDNPFMPSSPQQAYADPRRDESTLGSLMEGSLGGLAYLGKVLDKAFGARALRGVLDGNFGEVASVLPFSDTLGITDERNTVQPRNLLDKWGVTTPGNDSWENTAAEIGLGIGLDPGTWLGAAVPKLVARGGIAAGRSLGAGSAALTGGRVNPFTFGSNLLEQAKAPVSALFEPAVGGSWIPKVQGVAREVFTPELKAGTYAANMDAAGANVRLAPFIQSSQDPVALRTALTQAGEGFTQDSSHALQRLGYGPADTADLMDIAIGLGEEARATRPAEIANDLTSSNILDLPDWKIAQNREVEAQNRYINAQNAAAARQGLPPPPLMGIQPMPWEADALYLPRTKNVFDNGQGNFARRLGQGLGGASEFQTGREEFLQGIPGGTATLNRFSMDPNLTGANRVFDQTQSTQALASEILGMPAAQIPLNHPVMGQAHQLADYLHTLPDEALQKGLYNMDIVGNVLHRKLDSVRNIASAKTTMDAISRPGFVRPAADLASEGQQFVRLPEFLDAMRLSATDANGFKAAHLKAAQMLGIAPQDMDKLKDMAIPMDIAVDLGRIGKAWSTPSSLEPVVKLWDNTVNWFKRNLTVPFPAFHTRNLMSGIFNMWRDGTGMGSVSKEAGDAMLGMIRGKTLTPEVAAKLYPGMSLDDASRAAVQELMGGQIAFTRSGQAAQRVNQGVGRGTMAEDVPLLGPTARPALQDAKKFFGDFVPSASGGKSLNPLNTEKFIPTVQGEKVGNAVEDWIRGTHYLSKRMQGASPEDALTSVLKYQIDYGSATEFEKNVMKRIMPWYSYSRGNMPPILEDLAKNPAKLLGTVRAVTGSRQSGEFVPPWIGEGAATPIPGAPEGSKRFISSFGLPVEDELVKMLGSALHGDAGRVAQQGFGMAIPFAKLPAEIATGTQMYSGRKFEDLRPYEFATLGGLVPENRARQASQVIANTPASRVIGSIDKFTDPRKDTLSTLLNTLTGTRITDVDLERTKAAAAMQLLKDQLYGQPGVKSHTDVYIPKDRQASVDPNDLALFNLLKEIEQRATQRAQQQKAVQQGAR